MYFPPGRSFVQDLQTNSNSILSYVHPIQHISENVYQERIGGADSPEELQRGVWDPLNKSNPEPQAALQGTLSLHFMP